MQLGSTPAEAELNAGPRSEVSYYSRASEDGRHPLGLMGGARSEASFHSRASDDGGGGGGGDSASDAGSAVTLDTTFSAETLASKASTSMHPHAAVSSHVFSLDDFAGHEIHAILETGEAEDDGAPHQHGSNVDELSRPGSNISSIDERLGDIKGVKNVAPWDEGEGGTSTGAGPSTSGGVGTSSAEQAEQDPQPYVVGGYDADAEYALKREAMAKAVSWAAGKEAAAEGNADLEGPGSSTDGAVHLSAKNLSAPGGGLHLLMSDEQCTLQALQAMQYRELTPADLRTLSIADARDEDERASGRASKRASESASEHGRSVTVGSELDGHNEAHSVSSASVSASVAASPAPQLHSLAPAP